VFTLKPILQPQTALAQGGYAGVQFSYSGGKVQFSFPPRQPH
jgi:hypothetical protein